MRGGVWFWYFEMGGILSGVCFIRVFIVLFLWYYVVEKVLDLGVFDMFLIVVGGGGEDNGFDFGFRGGLAFFLVVVVVFGN